MKKKVLYGFLAACFAFTAVGTLQSCKDELDDFTNHQYVYDQNKMLGLISGLRSDMEACKADCDTKIANLQAQITSNDGDIAKLQSDLSSLAGEVANRVTLDQLNTAITNLENGYKAYTDAAENRLDGKISDLKTDLDTQITAVTTLINNLSSDMALKFADVYQNINDIKADLVAANQAIDELQQKVTEANVKADNALAAIDAINIELDGIQTALGNHDQLIAGLRTDLNALDQKYEAITNQLQNEINQAYQEIAGLGETMGQMYNALMDEIDAVNASIDELNTKFNDLTNRVNDLLTSIVLQGTDNPIFGNFSLPWGIKANLAFDWYGKLTNDVNFPSPLQENTYNAEACLFTEEDLAFAKNYLGFKEAEGKVPAGFITNGSLGTVYMTLNPIGHNVTEGKTFSFETSAGNKLPFEIEVEPSDTELFFGPSRSVANGFYAADVVLPENEDAIYSVSVKIDEELKTAVKDILNDRSKRTALNLLKAVYDQIDGMLPAYAVRADWTSGDKNYAVVSGYDIAVATAQPLSYKFLEGQGTDYRLRTFGHMDNFIYKLKENGDLHFDFSDAQINLSDLNTTITLPEIEIEANVEPVTPNTITVNVGKIKIEGIKDASGNDVYTEPIIVEIKPENLQDLTNKITGAVQSALDQVKESVSGWSVEAQNSIDESLKQMMTEIQGKINDMMDKISGEINDKIDNIIDEFGGKAQPWFDRLNKVIDMYNRVADKINAFLAHPNEYLQVAAFYKASGSVGLLSNVKEDPTIFVNGGGQAFNIFLSSYTAETVAPAYKKYAAIINVYDENGNSVRDEEWQSLANTNAYSSGLNRILPGSTFKIAVPATYLKKGLTYELVYQGLDYSGVTSTRKFYIKVQ